MTVRPKNYICIRCEREQYTCDKCYGCGSEAFAELKLDDWNEKSIHDLMHDIETTDGATMDRSALLNIFDYIRQLEKEKNWLYGRLNQISDIIERGRQESKRFK